ncbi:MAG: hypothetical protein RR199_03710 [Alistipes sp.]
MRLKRAISLLLLAVYLFATSASAYASMSCDCISKHVHTTHVCGCCCSHSEPVSTAKESLSAPCCSDHHSTQIELYTLASSDHQRLTSTTLLDLLIALIADFAAETDALTVICGVVTERRTLFSQQEHILPSGLRAPPVLA